MDRGLVARLVVALLHAKHQLLLLDGCAASKIPDVEARLPSGMHELFWRVDAGGALGAIDEALAAAEVEGFAAPAALNPSGRPKLGPRLVIDNDA